MAELKQAVGLGGFILSCASAHTVSAAAARLDTCEQIPQLFSSLSHVLMYIAAKFIFLNFPELYFNCVAEAASRVINSRHSRGKQKTCDNQTKCLIHKVTVWHLQLLLTLMAIALVADPSPHQLRRQVTLEASVSRFDKLEFTCRFYLRARTTALVVICL